MNSAQLLETTKELRSPQKLRGSAATERYVELLTFCDPAASTPLYWRPFRDVGRGAGRNLQGTFPELHSELEKAQDEGCGIFMVVNEGGHKDIDITRVRANFIDADGVPLDDIQWHVPPHFIVQRDETHWHAYWLVHDVECSQFRDVQLRLATRYGTDRAVKNESRLMRVPGFQHLKDPKQPHDVVLLDYLPDSADALWEETLSYAEVTDGLPEPSTDRSDQAAQAPTDGPPIAFAELRKALSFIDPTFDGDYNRWVGMAKAIRHGQIPIIEGDVDWLGLVDEWCSGALWRERTQDHEFQVSTYEGREQLLREVGECPRTTGRLVALGTFFKLAKDNGYRPPPGVIDRYELARAEAEGFAGSEANDNDPEEDRPLSARELAEGVFPRAEHLLEDFILEKHVNLLHGDGGTGKTLLSEMMAVAVASGRPLFGHAAKQMPVLLVLCEDDYGETKERLARICHHFDVKLDDLPMEIWCRPGQDSSIVTIDDEGQLTHQQFHKALNAKLEAMGPGLVILDTVTDIAHLNEIGRLPVNALCKTVLGGLCRQYEVTILALAHPSKASMADGSFYSGATAWNNAVRNRLVLKFEGEGSMRALEVAKSNYGLNGKAKLQFRDGVFIEKSSLECAEQETLHLNAVYAIVTDWLDKGTYVVQGNGAGLKPLDVAKEVQDKHSLTLSKREVKDHLSTLVRRGKLVYEKANKNERGHYAGYRKGPNATD